MFLAAMPCLLCAATMRFALLSSFGGKNIYIIAHVNKQLDTKVLCITYKIPVSVLITLTYNKSVSHKESM